MNGKCLWSANPESPPITGYRNKGYDFTITSSTAYDHKWIYGRNIFDSIARIVDELFENCLLYTSSRVKSFFVKVFFFIVLPPF